MISKVAAIGEANAPLTIIKVVTIPEVAAILL